MPVPEKISNDNAAAAADRFTIGEDADRGGERNSFRYLGADVGEFRHHPIPHSHFDLLRDKDTEVVVGVVLYQYDCLIAQGEVHDTHGKLLASCRLCADTDTLHYRCSEDKVEDPVHEDMKCGQLTVRRSAKNGYIIGFDLSNYTALVKSAQHHKNQ